MKSRIREFNENQEQVISEINEFLNHKQNFFFNNITGLANPILGKNVHISKFLEIFLKGNAKRISLFFIIKQICLYLKNFILGFGYEASLIILSKKSRDIESGHIFGIFTFFNANKFEASIIDEIYFKGLQDKLNNQSINYFYLPIFYLLSRNPLVAVEQINLAKTKNKNLISPYELLNFLDVIKLFYFGVSFLITNLKTIDLKSDSLLQKSFNEAMILKLSNSEINKFIYYLVAKKIARKTKKLKVLIWYENISVDKCIIKGLRENKDIEILGGQFFLMLNQELNLFPSPFEIANNIVPDKILINQSLPSFAVAKERYFFGKGLRYEYIHNYELNSSLISESKNIAVCLCYIQEKDNFIVSLLSEITISDQNFLIKKHPGNLATKIPQKINCSEFIGSQEELLLNSGIVIGADSGILFEALALGRQVIVIASDDRPSFYVPPKKYKGMMWEIAYDAKEFQEKLSLLTEYRLKNRDEILKFSSNIREDYFKQNSKDILDILELK